MSHDPRTYRVYDPHDNLSLWERCRLIVEAGIRKYGDSGSLPVSGTGKARKKTIDHAKKKGKVMAPTPNDQHEPDKSRSRRDDPRPSVRSSKRRTRPR